MTFNEALKKEKRWHRRAVLINLFHKSMLLKRKKWTMRATAKKLGISLGNVSESIKLANAVMSEPVLEKFTRKQVLEVIKV